MGKNMTGIILLLYFPVAVFISPYLNN